MARDFRLTPAGRALLGTLRDADGELSGYALIQATGYASGTVYPLLERLTDAGLLTRRRETEDEWLAAGTARPLRKFYALTGAGREAVGTRPDGREGPIAIDPPGCGCTECITGEYVPLDQATDQQIADLIRGEMADHTYSGMLKVTVTVRVEHGDEFSREIDPALLGIGIAKED